MTSTTTAYPNSSAISLPPISSIDPHRQRASPSPAELHYQQQQQQQQHHPTSRQLPAPVQYTNMPPNMLRMDGMSGRPLYPGGPAYQMQSARMALPPSTDPNLMIAGRAHQKKEVKRRTKTGCMTCRKRRIKCDEARPECRNCLKSKRECLGYDPPVYPAQSTPPLPIQSAPTSHPLGGSSAPSNPSLNHHYSLPPPSSPSLSSKAPSVGTETSLDTGDYPTPKHDPGQHQQHYHRSNPMEGAQESREAFRSARPYSHSSVRKAIPRSIDELCTIEGNRRPNLPPLPTDPPNLDAIQKIYKTAFAPGLDKLLETRWYSRHSFAFIVSDRDLLAQFLAYITLIHTNQNNNAPGQQSPALASQEARITWAFLSLCSKAAAVPQPDPEVRIVARRFKALEILITSEPVRDTSLIPAAEDDDHTSPTSSALQKQFAQRSRDFWLSFGRFVSLLHPACEDLETLKLTAWPQVELAKCRERLDNLESRDVLFCIMHMHALGLDDQDKLDTTMTGTEQGPGAEQSARDWELARELLEREAGGVTTSQVFASVSGIALRAWDWGT